MKKTAIFMAEGCEEIEGLTVVDVLRRAKMEIDMVSVTEKRSVTGSHGITFETDKTIKEIDFGDYDAIVLPGGIPGTPNLEACELLTAKIKEFAGEGKLIAAICAAPSIFGHLGLLEGKRATSYPGFDKEMTGCRYVEDDVVVDGNVITSRGMGTAIDFALTIVAYYSDEANACELGKKFLRQEKTSASETK